LGVLVIEVTSDEGFGCAVVVPAVESTAGEIHTFGGDDTCIYGSLRRWPIAKAR